MQANKVNLPFITLYVHLYICGCACIYVCIDIHIYKCTCNIKCTYYKGMYTYIITYIHTIGSDISIKSLKRKA